MNRNWIMNNLEQDWDDENMYLEVLENGTIRKYDLSENLMFEYQVERVAH